MEIKNSGKRKMQTEQRARILLRGCDPEDLGGAKGLPIKGARLNRITAKAKVGPQAMEDLVEKGEGVPQKV